MPIRLRSSRLLVAFALALVVQGTANAWPRSPLPNPIPGAVVMTVRTCVAAIDRFLVDGKLDALWHALDTSGHGLDPWPTVDEEQRDLVALAFRATYPELRLSLARISPSGEFFAIEIAERGAQVHLPSSLPSTDIDAAVDLDTLVALDRKGAIVRTDPDISNGALVYTPPDADAAFPVSASGRFLTAEITLTPHEHGERYLSVDGPGLVAPRSESLHLSGMGRLLVLTQGGAGWRSLRPSETTTIEPGDLLYIASGFAILTMTTPAPAQLIYSSVTSDNDNDKRSAPEGGRYAATHLTDMVANASPPESTWFGSIDSTASYTFHQAPPLAVLAATWIVVPPGAGTELAIGAMPYLAIDISARSTSPTQSNRALPISSSSGQPQIFLMLRIASA